MPLTEGANICVFPSSAPELAELFRWLVRVNTGMITNICTMFRCDTRSHMCVICTVWCALFPRPCLLNSHLSGIIALYLPSPCLGHAPPCWLYFTQDSEVLWLPPVDRTPYISRTLSCLKDCSVSFISLLML